MTYWKVLFWEMCPFLYTFLGKFAVQTWFFGAFFNLVRFVVVSHFNLLFKFGFSNWYITCQIVIDNFCFMNSLSVAFPYCCCLHHFPEYAEDRAIYFTLAFNWKYNWVIMLRPLFPVIQSSHPRACVIRCLTRASTLSLAAKSLVSILHTTDETHLDSNLCRCNIIWNSYMLVA